SHLFIGTCSDVAGWSELPPPASSQHRQLRDFGGDDADRRRADVRRIASADERGAEGRDSESVGADLAPSLEPEAGRIEVHLKRWPVGRPIRRCGGGGILLSQLVDCFLA